MMTEEYAALQGSTKKQKDVIENALFGLATNFLLNDVTA